MTTPTHPSISVDTDGLRISVAYAGRDAWNDAPMYEWHAHDVSDPTPLASSTWTTSRTGHTDLRTALAVAVTYCAAGSDYSAQPAELHSINPQTWERMLTAIGCDVPERLAERVHHVTAGRTVELDEV